MNTIIIMIFGFFGGIMRFKLEEFFPKIGEFPVATLFVNLAGCFCLAFFVEKYFVSKKAPERLLLGIGTGFIGSFTTFSSCMVELSNLFLKGHIFIATLYIFLSIVGGLFLIFWGMKLGQRFLFERKEL
ncbi:MAG: CrcB family protein [Lactobacillales bacterium]|jgi:CrcB protein|nr:CrcB family protein [Lactobacillales bacterium]